VEEEVQKSEGPSIDGHQPAAAWQGKASGAGHAGRAEAGRHKHSKLVLLVLCPQAPLVEGSTLAACTPKLSTRRPEAPVVLPGRSLNLSHVAARGGAVQAVHAVAKGGVQMARKDGRHVVQGQQLHREGGGYGRPAC